MKPENVNLPNLNVCNSKGDQLIAFTITF